MPTNPIVAALVLIALADGQVIDDLVHCQDHTRATVFATRAAEMAFDDWTANRPTFQTNKADAIRTATARALIKAADRAAKAADQAAADMLADGIEAGDLNWDGDVIPYDTYRCAF